MFSYTNFICRLVNCNKPSDFNYVFINYCTQIKELPPLKPVKQLTERVEDMIKEIRESKTVKVVPLGMHISYLYAVNVNIFPL